MNELIGFMASLNFHVSIIHHDGKIHRFDRDGKKNAWYIANEFFTSNGESYLICSFGDWKTDEKYTHRPQKKLPKTEITKINKQIEKDSKKAEFEEQNLQNEVSEYAEKEWKILSSKNIPEYCAKKSIDQLYGCKTILEGDGRCLAVPCRDVNGKLWGIQKVHNNGDKYFTPGQKVKGTFHLISESNDLSKENQIYICEGFATAASIFMATKTATISAFNASNLIDVAKIIKKKFNHLSIIICGDDDKKTDGNPGRSKAEEAAKAVMGAAIFPKFVNEQTNPTDFNDLHQLEGIKAVADQICPVEAEKSYIICLGHKEGKFFYTSSRNKEITIISSSERIVWRIPASVVEP